MFSLNKKLFVALLASAVVAGSAVANYEVSITNMSPSEVSVRIERVSIFCPAQQFLLQPGQNKTLNMGVCCTSSIRVNPTNAAQEEAYFNMSDIATGAGIACRGYKLNVKAKRSGALYFESVE